ncbi:MAG: DJ-1/PfpI family protein [Gemmataceae bacterium]|nr:DJ-1/PfpI family protein [Gemmataceae bacterium]MDW8242408.1 DJ-1/PfpI family protein [Thermogemmata sp.]
MKALLLLDDGFEDVTVHYLWYRMQEAGWGVCLASPVAHILTGEHSYRIEPDTTIHEINPADYDLLLIPDGSCVERLRLREEAVDVTRTFVQDGATVAAVGHGPQLLISAGVLDGRRVTCAPGIRDDVRAAGADYRDEAVVVDGPLFTCRHRDDLPLLMPRLLLQTRVSPRN